MRRMGNGEWRRVENEGWRVRRARKERLRVEESGRENGVRMQGQAGGVDEN